eukprot:CAMPEP_0119537046 /NCGR_PEP_ID=MMETSP1344-20130328/49807_1 /TAXON_ID=236787 /ORGANISM="Florenciella parvula, Strain CCMP2471" /LENGTH=67 /DNA_ID=CAMNT_0007579401 /DNA_START=66 /DNA_END=269 /DNA_ORIENTATION=+
MTLAQHWPIYAGSPLRTFRGIVTLDLTNSHPFLSLPSSYHSYLPDYSPAPRDSCIEAIARLKKLNFD